MNFKTILFVSAAPLLLTACGNAQENEAKRLGFSSAFEMEDIHQKGWHTNAQYRADETVRAKRLGFVDMDELHDAESAGIMDPVAYRKHKAEEDAREAAEEASNSKNGEAEKSGDGESGSEPSTDQVSVSDTNAQNGIKIDLDDYYDAVLLHKDKSGKTDLSYWSEMEAGKNISVKDAFFYALAAGSSDWWEAKFTSSNDGSFAVDQSHRALVICSLTSQYDKSYFTKNPNKRKINISGTIEYTDSGKIFLQNCKFS